MVREQDRGAQPHWAASDDEYRDLNGFHSSFTPGILNGLLGPLRLGFRHQLIVYVDRINALIEKAQEVGDRRTGDQWLAVAPHDVLEGPLANRGGPIRCLAFLGTTGSGLGRF